MCAITITIAIHQLLEAGLSSRCFYQGPLITSIIVKNYEPAAADSSFYIQILWQLDLILIGLNIVTTPSQPQHNLVINFRWI